MPKKMPRSNCIQKSVAALKDMRALLRMSSYILEEVRKYDMKAHIAFNRAGKQLARRYYEEEKKLKNIVGNH